MINLKKVLGCEFILEKLSNRITLVSTADQKYLIKKRSFYSEENAIKVISEFGISQVIEVSNEEILETYNPFEKQFLTLKDYARLAQKIHQTKNHGVSLVHGDLSRHNTTLINGKIFCFDYEHTHWGNPFADLGRILLRECESYEDSLFFLETYYSNSLPDINELQNGIIYFCDWQHKIRKEKKLEYSEVPLIRKGRVLKTNLDLENIMYEFKREI